MRTPSDWTPSRFTLTGEHVALLRAANVCWMEWEWGAASIDAKRPYGSGDLARSIHEILHPDSVWNDGCGMPNDKTPAEWEKLVSEYRELHRWTAVALQIVLSTGSFESGDYEVTSKYGYGWRLITPTERS